MTRRDRVYRYVVREIGKAVEESLPSIQLFQISKSNDILELKEKNYIVILNAAMNFFVTKEMYEDAAVCRDIIRQINEDVTKGEEND